MIAIQKRKIQINFEIGHPKIVILGAGKIGRSFIGQLFSRGGYEVVFVDIFKPVIEELNVRGNYKVIIKSEADKVLNINNVRGVLATESETVAYEIATADIMAVSIGQQGLSSALALIAKGLMLRRKLMTNNALDIIIAENLRNASDFFRAELTNLLPLDFPINEMVGLVETSIGKMVPIMLKKDMEADILQVFAEPYNNLILDKKAFKNSIPTIDGLSPKENMKAWVDRKLFIHNLGHATTAYLGYQYNPEFVFIYEALAVTEIKNKVRETMLQAAAILQQKYPDEFTMEALTEHTDDLISRFENRALGDTIYRVGCDLKRKLSAEDRLAGAIRLALELNMPYNKIRDAYIAGCTFKAVDEAGNRLKEDIDFSDKYERMGLEWVLSEIAELEIKKLIKENLTLRNSVLKN